MFTQAPSSAHRAVASQEGDEPELIETKAGPRPSPQRVDLPMDLLLSSSGSNRDDAGTALGEVVFHLSNGRSRLGTELQHQAPPVIGNLGDMPEDLLDMIAGFVPHEDIASLAMVCKTWRDTLNRPRRNRITGQWDRALEPSVQLHSEAICKCVNARFENLSRTAVAGLHARLSSISELESACAAATVEREDRDRKFTASNDSLPVVFVRNTAMLGNFSVLGVMGFGGGALGLDEDSVRGYGFLALLGSSLLLGLTWVRTAYHGVRSRQARTAVQSTAQRLEERRALVRAEVGPFPVAPELSGRVMKVDTRIWINIESTAPIPPLGAEPAL